MDALDPIVETTLPATPVAAVPIAAQISAAPIQAAPQATPSVQPNVQMTPLQPITPANALDAGVMKTDPGAAPELPSVDLRRAPENLQVKQVANADNVIQGDTARQAYGASLDTQKSKVLTSEPGTSVDQTTKAGRELASLQTQQVKSENNRFAGDVQRVDDQVTADTSTSWVARLNNSTAHFDWRRQGVDTTLTVGLQAQAALEKTQQQAKSPVAPITPTAGPDAAQAKVTALVAQPQAAKPRMSVEALNAQLAAAPVKEATAAPAASAPTAGTDRAATAAEIATAAAVGASAFTQARNESFNSAQAPAAAAQSRAISAMSLNQSSPVYSMSNTAAESSMGARFTSVNPDGTSLGTTTRTSTWSQPNVVVEAQIATPRSQPEFRSTSPMGRFFASGPMDMAYGLLPGASSTSTRQVKDAVLVDEDKATAAGTIQNAGSLALSLKPVSAAEAGGRGPSVGFMLAQANKTGDLMQTASLNAASSPVPAGVMRAQQPEAPRRANQPTGMTLSTGASSGR